MDVSWTGVLIVLGGLAAIVALSLWGGADSAALQTAILAGCLGLLAPHPIRRATHEPEPEPDADEDAGG